ncbi:MAG TPA: radical SAM protein [Rhodospirillales bacterium]|nr:radical SAM protein [Rhodospirillales bacterium]
MLETNTLTVILTNRCNAACDHCCMNSGPDRMETVEVETLKAAIDQLHDENTLAVVVFAGGEPTLAKSVLRQALRHCQSKGILTRMVSNASWAKSPSLASKILQRLKDDGLSELNISADDFHLPYVPFNNVVNAWKAAKGIGFISLVIANSSSRMSKITPGFIRRMIGEDTLLRIEQRGQNQTLIFPPQGDTLTAISTSMFQRLERAEKSLHPDNFYFIQNEEDLIGVCPHAYCSPAISPRGHLLACCGFELDGNPVLDFGDLKSARLASIRETALNNPILKGIIYLGPHYLMELVRQVAPEIHFNKQYSSVCEVCRSLTKNPKAVEVLLNHDYMYSPAVKIIERRKKPVAA